MSRKKKCIIFLVLVGLLFILSTGAGFFREEDKMSIAMKRVKGMVAQARNDIKKEMEKPFFLRLIGSLFGMEGNKFRKLKEELPAVIKDAMPTSLGKFTNASKPQISCDGMRLSDALLLLQQKKIKLAHVYWTFNSNVRDEKYILLSGTVISSKHGPMGMDLTLQMWHPYNGENGIETDDGIAATLQQLRQQETLARKSPQTLGDWFPYEDHKKRNKAMPPAIQNLKASYRKLEQGDG